MITPDFQGRLTPYVIGLIEQKCALGYNYTAQTILLKKFDKLCQEQFPDDDVTKPMLDIWSVLKSCENPRTLQIRVTAVIIQRKLPIGTLLCRYSSGCCTAAG